MALKNLLVRTATGIIFVGVMVSAICYSSFSFLVLFGLITGLTVWEFTGLMKNYEESSMLIEIADGIRVRVEKTSVFASAEDAQTQQK